MKMLFERINEFISQNTNAIIGIDGPCAAGKTTLAVQLAQKYDMQIIHMDDFFLPFEMRTEQRLSQAGGNIHYERFNAEVVSGLKKGTEFVYRAFSCKHGDFTETRRILPDKPILIEGSYAFHPKIELNYDLKIFVKADYKTRIERIFERNGREALEVFKDKWIPLEDQYFAEFEIEKKSDIIKQTEK